jgi:CHAT domain-containing protein
LTRPFDKHLDEAELEGLVSLSPDRVPGFEAPLEPVLAEVQRHVESCTDCNRKVQMHRDVQTEFSRLGPTRFTQHGSACPTDADWLRLAAGLVPETKARELMSHAAQCDHCGPLLRRAADTLSDETTPEEESVLAGLGSVQPDWQRNLAGRLSRTAQGISPTRSRAAWWKGVLLWPRPALIAGALAVVTIAGWLGLNVFRIPSTETLLAQAYTEHRTLELRISGAKYGPMRVQRNTGGSNLDRSSSLLKAEALIGEKLKKSPSDPAWLQLKARADLLDDNYESAIKSLDQALDIEPDSPKLLTDLASAYFERAEATDRAIDYGNAIESLGKALAKSPDDAVALFNRAVVSERLFLYTQAVDDWEHYLRIDPQGGWADEARRQLAALREKLKQHEQSEAEPLLSPSDTAFGEGAVTRGKVDARIEDYLDLAITDWLPGAYPTSQQTKNNMSDVGPALALLSDVAVQNHGDRWLADVLSTPLSANFAGAVAELSATLRANKVGDNVAARQHAAHAERLFILAGSAAGALRARVEYMFASQDAQNGQECLRAARGVASGLEGRSYRWLKAQYLIEQGNCVWFLGNMGKARQAFDQASQEARASAYGAIYLRSQDHFSLLVGAVGDLQSAWARNQQALTIFWSGRYPAMRGYNLYYGRYEFARAMRQPHLQMSAWLSALALSESFDDNVLRAMAHSLMASAAVAAEQPGIAAKEFTLASQLFSAAPQIDSTRIDRMEVETRLAEVEATHGAAQQAVLRLQQLEPKISQLSDNFLAILFYTTLGEAESAVGEDKEAESALISAIALSELQLQSVSDDASRLKWSQQTSGTYRNFAQLRLSQGDAQAALEIWEWYQGSALRSERASKSHILNERVSPPKPHEVATQLPGLTKVTVISYALLPRGIATWVYDNRGVFAHWTDGNPGDISARVQRFRGLCSDPNSDESDVRREARMLYDLLAAPIEHHLSSDRTLIVELDEGLAGLPFDALLDTQNQYLDDHNPIISSLGIYYRAQARAAVAVTADATVLVAAVPTSSAGADPTPPALPDAVSEGETVARSFTKAQLLAGKEATVEAILALLPRASVFHFAGHAISSAQEAGLLLSDGVLSSTSLKETPLSRMQLAVFSACNTQGGSNGELYAADNMVRIFLHAGVPYVIGSRWDVDSESTREFMNLFYRALLNGSSVAESIHRAKLGLRSSPGMSHPYYWSAFTAFGTA